MNSSSLLKIAVAPIALLVIHTLVTIFGYYESYWWLDIPMHFLGGIAIAASAYFLLQHFQELNQYSNSSKILQFLIIVSIVALSAVAWEVMEFSLDFYYLTEMQPTVQDTMKDLSIGLIGGSLTALFFSKPNLKK